MKQNIFKILLLIARPAAGKSEIIDHLKNTDVAERIRRFHIGAFEEIDDFPMIWTWFEEDAILQRLGYPRLYTDQGNNFIGNHLWNLLIERISLEYDKLLYENPVIKENRTVIIEFARGTEHGGYAEAFKHLSREIVKKMAVLYINVSWEESFRKNRIRFNPNKPYSILEHGLPDQKLVRLYRYVDWEEVSGSDPHYLSIQGIQVPYVVLENEDDVTTKRGKALTQRLENTLDKLWNYYKESQLKVNDD
jgi:hypothetical protein